MVAGAGPVKLADAKPGKKDFALRPRLISLCHALSDGVMVAHGSLEPIVMVRIHVGQPLLNPTKTL